MNTGTRPKTNRRANKRRDTDLSLLYKVEGETEDPVEVGPAVDISSNGVSFLCEGVLPMETRIVADLFLPSLNKKIKFSGSVVRIEANLKSNKYLHGIAFTRISEQDKIVLRNYVWDLDIGELLRQAAGKGASDLHLVANKPPIIRIEGELEELDTPPLDPEELKEIILSLMTEKMRSRFEKKLDMDFLYLTDDGFRCRVNVHFEKGYLDAALRIVPREAKTIGELGLPQIVGDWSKKRSGLIIVSGPAGSGKSTTLTALIEKINKERKCMIVSIEDPIEFVYTNKKSVIKQREIGVDTLSFKSALKYILRQDPNVILVGEIRDAESISMVLTAAATGHLVLTTLHTRDSAESIRRMVEAYPVEQQSQVRNRIASCIEGIISQALIPKKGGKGRVLATEVMVSSTAIRNLIKAGKTDQITSYLETSHEKGMFSMDESLVRLFCNGIIEKSTAKEYARELAKISSVKSGEHRQDPPLRFK
ncbi:MAG: PilT/PilU family type 4a pilus ATPase [Nitrospinota bacterium]